MEQLFFYVLGFVMGALFMWLVKSVMDGEGGKWE